VTLSDLAKYSTTRSVTWSLCDIWASCSVRSVCTLNTQYRIVSFIHSLRDILHRRLLQLRRVFTIDYRFQCIITSNSTEWVWRQCSFTEKSQPPLLLFQWFLFEYSYGFIKAS